MLSFLLFVLWTVAIFLFAPSLRRQFLEWKAKKREAKKAKAKKQILGLGFGYDGLTEAELQQAQKQEEDDASKLPRYPPSLSAIQFLPPITIPTGSDVAHHPSDDANSESNLDPAPVYK
ncbi:hypothetical protein DFH08DRAFT_843956 [Mycena albidolilacea]|uniref:Uncharacterized protein n=1 Tax=Mycena albidolilacea TaxID=1033008 RepID=A0AAD7AKD2_9AGAR|nr:hypothetical protein DFH08DRAFT_843956 [Mycena albidolilacea]